MPGSPAESLTSTVASPPDTEIPTSHSGKATKETVIPSVLTSNQAVCSPTTRCQTPPARSAR